MESERRMMIEDDEHRRHLDEGKYVEAYHLAIERAAIQETGESTKEIEERTVKDGTVDKG